MNASEFAIFGAMFAFGALIYFIPTMVATVRRHPQQTAIFWLNFFAGWTFLGWVGALVWALVQPMRTVVMASPIAQSNTPAIQRYTAEMAAKDIGDLADILAKGLITGPEFEAKKAELLAKV